MKHQVYLILLKITQYYLILKSIDVMRINMKRLLSPDGKLFPAWGRETRVPDLDAHCSAACGICYWGWPAHEGWDLPTVPSWQQKLESNITKDLSQPSSLCKPSMSTCARHAPNITQLKIIWCIACSVQRSCSLFASPNKLQILERVWRKSPKI